MKKGKVEIGFKVAAQLFKAFAAEDELNDWQLNAMESAARYLNAGDPTGKLNEGESYTIAKQDDNPFFHNDLPPAPKGFNQTQKPIEVDVEPEVIEAYQETLGEWKAEFIANHKQPTQGGYLDGFNDGYNKALTNASN